MYGEEPVSSDPSNVLSTITEGGTISLETEQTFCDEPSEKNHRDIWNDIMKDHSEAKKNILDFIESNKPRNCERFGGCATPEWEFMTEEVFPTLMPAIQSMMFKAQKWGMDQANSKRFNGIDHLSELLWNFNPKYPDRYKTYKDIFDIPFAITWLDQNPRPHFKLSQVWSDNYAALLIQSYYRGYLVRKRPDVQEMRDFWRKLLLRTRSASLMIPISEHSKSELICRCEGLDSQSCFNPEECFETAEEEGDDSFKTVPAEDSCFF